MPKVTGPAFSLAASKSLKKTLTFQKRPSGFAVYPFKKPFSREYGFPSPAQRVQRDKIKALVEQWQALSSASKDLWDDAAISAGFVGTGYHYFLHKKGAGLPPGLVPPTVNTYSITFDRLLSQYAWVADNTDVSITGDISLEFDLKLKQLPSVAGDHMVVIGKGDPILNTRCYYVLIHKTADTMRFYISDDGSLVAGHVLVVLVDASLGAGDVGAWHRWSVTLDVSAADGRWYKDGSPVATTVNDQGARSIVDNNSKFLIGAQMLNGVASRFTDAKVDDGRLWNVVRTPAEILANYQKELAGSEPGFAGYWRFNNNADDSAKSSDLTLVNNPVFTIDVPF